NLVRLLAKPDGCGIRRGVDVAYYSNLLAALRDIVLVDVKRIRPEEGLTVGLLEMLQGAVQVGADLDFEARAANCFLELRFAPYIG
ncbi:hypothetical protein BKA56DRAFT_698855, partial [Ilyonectria sp. MPI-CAGE-AT-0026]